MTVILLGVRLDPNLVELGVNSAFSLLQLGHTWITIIPSLFPASTALGSIACLLG